MIHITHTLTAGCPQCQAALYQPDTESPFIAAVLWVISADAEVLISAVCTLYPARYDKAENVMTASLSSRIQQVLAVDISELDTKLVTATEGNKLFGLVYKKISGMA